MIQNHSADRNKSKITHNLNIMINKSIKSILIAGLSLGILTSTSFAAHHKSEKLKNDIVDVASSASDFSTLVAAVSAADLVSVLKGDGPFTVFAPTNEAFAKLPAGTVEDLLKPENKDKLVEILTYHVVSGKIMAADVKSGSVKTANGQSFQVKLSYGKVFVDDAQVIQTDIGASNGIIHAIDSVIMPSS